MICGVKIFFFQVRKIILVQACVRRFLIRKKYIRMKREMTFSVLTIQKYIRGWIARKNTQELKKKQKRSHVPADDNENQKPSEKENKKYIINADPQFKKFSHHDADDRFDKSKKHELFRNRNILCLRIFSPSFFHCRFKTSRRFIAQKLQFQTSLQFEGFE